MGDSSGRDFSRDFRSDTSAVILNETVAKYLGEKDVVGKTVRNPGIPYTVIGIVRDVVFTGPYDPVRPSLYFLNNGNQLNWLTLRLNPEHPMSESVAEIEAVIKTHMNMIKEYTYECKAD